MTWQPTDTRIDHAPTMSVNALIAEIACEGDLVVVVWEDDRNGKEDVFLNISEDRGVTWQSVDTRLDTDVPGADDSAEPFVDIEGDSIYVTWGDAVFGGPGIATAYGIGVASHHESAYVDWADDRAGFLRIHANRARP